MEYSVQSKDLYLGPQAVGATVMKEENEKSDLCCSMLAYHQDVPRPLCFHILPQNFPVSSLCRLTWAEDIFLVKVIIPWDNTDALFLSVTI